MLLVHSKNEILAKKKKKRQPFVRKKQLKITQISQRELSYILPPFYLAMSDDVTTAISHIG